MMCACEIAAASADMYLKSHHGLLSNVKDKKNERKPEFSHLGIFTEQFVYVRVNMF